MNSTSKIVTAFLAGAVVGASLGILLAPDKGEVTRKKIKDSVEDLSHKASEQFKKIRKKKKEEEDEDENENESENE